MLKEKTNEIGIIVWKMNKIGSFNKRDEEFEEYMDEFAESNNYCLKEVIEWSNEVALNNSFLKDKNIEEFASQEVFTNVIKNNYDSLRYSKEFLNILRYIYYDFISKGLGMK